MNFRRRADGVVLQSCANPEKSTPSVYWIPLSALSLVALLFLTRASIPSSSWLKWLRVQHRRGSRIEHETFADWPAVAQLRDQLGLAVSLAYYQQLITDCNQEIQQRIRVWTASADSKASTAPGFDLRRSSLTHLHIRRTFWAWICPSFPLLQRQRRTPYPGKVKSKNRRRQFRLAILAILNLTVRSYLVSPCHHAAAL